MTSFVPDPAVRADGTTLRSAGEMQAIVRKAAIGRGIDAGSAIELAAAVRWLADRGHDGAALAVAVVDATDVVPGLLSAVDEAVAGRSARTDGGADGSMALLVFGFAGVAASALGCRFELLGDGWSAVVGAAINGDLPTGGPFTLRCVEAGPEPPDEVVSAVERVAVTDADWQVLCEAAAETHVPSSRASRARGAGAGLTDND